MTDETNPVAYRINQVENEWKAKGEIHHAENIKGVTELMQRKDDAHVCGDEALTQGELVNRLMSPTNTSKLEYDAASVLPQKDWDNWYMRNYPNSRKGRWLRRGD